VGLVLFVFGVFFGFVLVFGVVWGVFGWGSVGLVVGFGVGLD